MSKKGLISSLIIALVATLSLGIYTIVSVVVGNKVEGPSNTTMSVVYRTGDHISVLDGYSVESGNLAVTLDAETAESPLVYEETTGKYTAGAVNGGLTAVLTLDEKGNTKTIQIKVYKQGTGSSADDAFIIASAAHLKEFAGMVNTLSGDREVPAYTKLVSDIDISEYNWEPIGTQGDGAYTGTFDGNGHSVKGLTIDVNTENYLDMVSINTKEMDADGDGDKELVNNGYIDLGLFGKIEKATIKNLSVENATISVSPEVYTILAEETIPEGASYDRFARLSIGAIAGSAYRSNITGALATDGEGVVTEKATIVSRINGFSFGELSDAANGIGGVVGYASLVEVSDYNVKINVINNHVVTKASYIGGVVGYATSSLSSSDSDALTADDMTTVKGVEVDFTSTALYSNNSFIGGLVGVGYNVTIADSKVNSFKIVDTTARSTIDHNLATATVVGGVSAFLVTNASGYTNNYISNVENVAISNVDVYMLGGNIAGAIATAGVRGSSKEGLTITNVSVAGTIAGNRVAGVVYDLNSDAKVVYTKAYDTAVVDLVIKANMSAGFVFNNFGSITGYVDAETQKMTAIDVEFKAMGGLVLNASDRETLVSARNNTFAVGFVAKTGLVSSTVIPTISNFDITYVAKDTLNMAGIAYEIGTAVISNINVNADITSFNYTKEDKNFSTTYMVAGAVCKANAGAELSNINVIINVNKGVDTTKKYGTTFFGGLVARYLGDSTVGITINNCEVAGDVFFNYTSENTVFGEEEVGVFLAGGIIGSISSDVATTLVGVAENVDAFDIVSVDNTTITNVTVENLKMTAGFVTDAMDTASGWRVRAIGALIGSLVIETADKIDLSTCKSVEVEIVADEDTFTFNKAQQGGQLVRVALGAGKTYSYGTSYLWALNGAVLATVEPTQAIDVTYTPYVA